MTVLMIVLGIALFGGIAGAGFAWFSHWTHEGDSGVRARLAARSGLRFAARTAYQEDADLRALGFRALDRKGGGFSNVCAGTMDGVTVKAFDFSPIDEHHALSCAVAILPAPAPQFSLQRESVASRARRVVGKGDVELGDPEFDRAFKVTCDDVSRLDRFLHPALRRWLIDTAPRDLNFEMRGWTVLASRQRPADVNALLGAVRSIAQLVPPRPTTGAEDAVGDQERQLVEALTPAPETALRGQLLTAFVIGATIGLLIGLFGALAQRFPL